MRLVVLIALACACEPDLDGTAFKCNKTPDCPSDQMCFSGRCRRMEHVDIKCGDELTCGPTEQCCSGLLEGDRCLPAGNVCPNDSALCDGKNDCVAGKELCCAGDNTTACALNCPSNEVACTTDMDCPDDASHCCKQLLLPWNKCSDDACTF